MVREKLFKPTSVVRRKLLGPQMRFQWVVKISCIFLSILKNPYLFLHWWQLMHLSPERIGQALEILSFNRSLISVQYVCVYFSVRYRIGGLSSQQAERYLLFWWAQELYMNQYHSRFPKLGISSSTQKFTSQVDSHVACWMNHAWEQKGLKWNSNMFIIRDNLPFTSWSCLVSPW